jgi:hypothetical protein
LRRRAILGVLAVASLLCGLGSVGCGVITVDVDVYKGPLANHEDVQAEQAVATAIAAKPLLGRLRYQLEYAYRYPNSQYKYSLYSFFGLKIFPKSEPLSRLESSTLYIQPLQQPQRAEEPITSARELDTQVISDLDDADEKAFEQGQFAFRSKLAALVNKILAEYDYPDERTADLSKMADVEVAELKGLAGDASPLPDVRRRSKQAQAELARRSWRDARDRVGAGLESLAQHHAEQVTRDSAPSDIRSAEEKIPSSSCADSQRRLSAALVSFSQKILFVANNEALFQVRTGVLPGINLGLQSIFLGGEDSKAPGESYVRVLQAVGNSILVSLNELREQEKHRTELSDPAGVERERQALRAALRPNAFQALRDLIVAADAERAENEKGRPLAYGQTLAAAVKQAADRRRQAEDDLAGIRKELGDPDPADTVRARDDLVELLDGGILSPVTAAAAKPLDPPPGADSGADLRRRLEAALAGDAQAARGDAARFNRLSRLLASLAESEVATVVFADKGSEAAKVLAAARAAAVRLAVAARANASAESTARAKAWAAAADQAVLARREKLVHGADAMTKAAQAVVSAAFPDPDLGRDAVLTLLVRELEKRRERARAVKTAAPAGDGGKAPAAGAPGAGAASAAGAAPAAGTAPAAASAPAASGGCLSALLNHVRGWLARCPATSAAPPASTTPSPTPAPPAPVRPPGQDEQDAIDLVKERSSLPAVPPAAPPPGLAPKTRKDVVDELIATLNYQYVLAVQQYGKTAPVTQNYADALDAAYGRRADLIYLRPASAYLRSSFPTSSLQKDARIGWSNMLANHGWRQVPFIGNWVANGDQQALRTVLELDKQNWQNVNTVRVAGYGDTNYVIAKDDIGNWYVKNYSTDIKEVVKSAKGLALFGLGSTLKGGADLVAGLRRDDEVAKLMKAGKTVEAAAAATQPVVRPADSPLARALAEAVRQYDGRTADDLKAAKADAAGLPNAVASAWVAVDALAAHQPDLSKAVAAAAKPLAEAAAAADKPDDALRPADRVVDLLRAAKAFHGTLAADVRTRLTTAPADALKAKQDERAKADKKLADAQAKADKVTAADREDARLALERAEKDLAEKQAKLEKARAATRPSAAEAGGGVAGGGGGAVVQLGNLTPTVQVFVAGANPPAPAKPAEATVPGKAAPADPAKLTPDADRLAKELDAAERAAKAAEAERDRVKAKADDLAKVAADAVDARKAAEKAADDVKAATEAYDAARKAADTAVSKLTAVVRGKVAPVLKRRGEAANEYTVQLDLITKAQAR